MPTKVLVFESDPAFAGELRTELSRLGLAAQVVDDGNAGLSAAASDKPDLILLSIELPRMNGFSVCNKLKKDPALKDVPLIIMSSESSDETFEQHRKLRTRAEDYVHKPIAFGELLRHIQVFVNLGGAPTAQSIAPEDIVIDDEIQIEEEGGAGGAAEVLQRSDQLAALAPQAVPRDDDAPVDSEIDALADAAFGRMTSNQGTPASAQ